MQGLMMNFPLMISSLVEHAARHHGATPVVSRESDGSLHQTNWYEINKRSRLLADWLVKEGVTPGMRVATLAWNTHRHLEAYYAISGCGAVCHTINPRLFKEQISGIMNHAEDVMIFTEKQFIPLIDSLNLELPSLRVIIMDQDTSIVSQRYPTLHYEECLQDLNTAMTDWPVFDENQASSLCYTSGTTGNPKGVMYSHRSTLLHAYAVALPDSLGLSAQDSVLPVVPLFHANAWGIPYAAALVGAKLVLPGHQLDGLNLATLLNQEKVSVTAGVPTVWHGLIQYLLQSKTTLPHLKRLGVGGAACPEPILRFFEERGVRVLPGWGMTETSPVVTLTQPKFSQRELTQDERWDLLKKSGRVLFGSDMKLLDEHGRTLPQDGKSVGELYVRGHWVCSNYYKLDQSPLRDGWFPTGDMATIDQDGFMQVTDRAKDMIKSGGEWISSLQLESIASNFPGVQEAAAIAAEHPHWGERPILLVQPKEMDSFDKEALLHYLKEHVAKWWLPDEILVVDQLPHTATGKLQKTELRAKWGRMLVDKKNPPNCP